MQSGLDSRSIAQAMSAAMRAKLAVAAHVRVYQKNVSTRDLGVPFVFLQHKKDSLFTVEDNPSAESNRGGTAILGEDETAEDDQYGLFSADLSDALEEGLSTDLQNELNEQSSAAHNAIVHSQLSKQHAQFEDQMNATYTPKQQKVLHISEGLYEGTLEQRVAHAHFMVTAGLLEVLRHTHDYEPLAKTISNLLSNR